MKTPVTLLGILLMSQVSYAEPIITSDGIVTDMSGNRGVFVLFNDPPASEQIYANIDQAPNQRTSRLLSGAESEIRRGESIQCARITRGDTVGSACEFRINPLGEIIRTSRVTGVGRTTPFIDTPVNAQVYSAPLTSHHEDGVAVTISGAGAALIYNHMTEVTPSLLPSQRATGSTPRTELQLEKAGRDLTCVKVQTSATLAHHKCSFHLDTTGTAHRDD